MKRMSKSKIEELRRKYDPPLGEILYSAVKQKVEMVNIFRLSKEIKIELVSKKGKKKLLAKYPVASHKGLIERIKYMAELPLRETGGTQRSMIQVCLTLPQGEKFIAFYVEARKGEPRYKEHLILAPIWASLSDC